MSQLHAAAAVRKYFSSPKTLYERYINKKWTERMDKFQSKQGFIKKAITEWKNSSDQEWIEFLSSKAPESKFSIVSFFKPVQKISTNNDRNKNNSDNDGTTEQICNPSEQAICSESQPQHSSFPSVATPNASEAVNKREDYLNEKEAHLIKTFLDNIECNGREFASSSDLMSDKGLTIMLRSLAYR